MQTTTNFEPNLYCGDCLDVLPQIDDHSVDLICADLPYSVTACSWDCAIDLSALWPEYRRVLKPEGAILLFGVQPFTSVLVTSALAWFKYEIVWEKNMGSRFLDAKRRPLNFHESVLLFGENPKTYNPQKWRGERNHGHKQRLDSKQTANIYRGAVRRTASDVSGEKYPRSVVYCEVVAPSRKVHPSQKPLPLIEYLLLTYSNPGDIVLDNAMGSGTTGEAARRTGRGFIGIEKSKRYFELAKRRIESALLPLFNENSMTTHCKSIYRRTYCELPEGHAGDHSALIIEKPFSIRFKWNYTCPSCKQEKPLDLNYINRSGMCQECVAQQSNPPSESSNQRRI